MLNTCGNCGTKFAESLTVCPACDTPLVSATEAVPPELKTPTTPKTLFPMLADVPPMTSSTEGVK